MEFAGIQKLLEEAFPNVSFEVDEEATPMAFVVDANSIADICLFLKDHEALFSTPCPV